MLKPVVYYTDIIGFPQKGNCMLVVPTNHPDTVLVSNSTWARTSPVVKINGEYEPEGFETENSQYRYLSTF
jgi:hypothetical protein